MEHPFFLEKVTIVRLPLELCSFFMIILLPRTVSFFVVFAAFASSPTAMPLRLQFDLKDPN